MKDPDEPIEVEFEIVDEGGDSSKKSRPDRQKSSAPSPLPQSEVWKAKLIVWSVIIGGIILLGLILFFFAALFVYFFIPIMVLAGIWFLIKNLFR